ncbi:MAG: methionine--tRNA ligase [Bacteroidetes bacterium]|nr:methionine--tRNA ligase [Bacteroidota bacterium]
MSKTFNRTLVTAALPYANGPVHIGHLAGCYLPADIYVRFMRSCGEEILFICGSDEHGVPITIKARNENITPKQVVDKYHEMMKESFREFGISFDHYSRTSSMLHHQTASDFFNTMYEKGEFVEETTQQYYDAEVNQFLADRYIEGTCPKCGNEKAYGDQCEKCGTSLNPMDLLSPVSKLSGSKPVLKETKNWFLPLDKYQERLLSWIQSKQDLWKPNVYGQCMSWLQQGLQPRAMTRDLDWGVKVPLPNTDGKVLYVWFDAPIGYISATKELFNGGDGWQKFWCQEDSRLLHFIGKDNIVFHCIIFPAMLMAHGNYILPENVPANEFLNLEGEKISTSRNWAVWLHQYLQDFKEKQDVLRYVLCSTMPETKDNDFTWKDFQARNNNELVAIFGNFVNRTLVLTQKFYNGMVPEAGEFSIQDKEIINAILNTKKQISTSLHAFRFREALQHLMDLARTGNKYLADNEPWKLIKTDEERVKTIMYVALEITAYLAALSEPFMPRQSSTLFAMLALQPISYKDANGQLLKAGHQTGYVALLFEKIEDDVIASQIEKLQATQIKNAVQATPIKDTIAFDDFAKMDIRVATILAAERVPKTDKLLKLILDAGADKRTVVSGIAQFYDPEKVIGQQVLLLANLEPRKIKGIESHGMILMAEDAAGQLCFASPLQTIDNGSTVK